MGLNLLSRVILHIVSFQCAVTLSLRVSFFTHLYLISVTLCVEIQSKVVNEQVCYHDIFCKSCLKRELQPTRLNQFFLPRFTISPPVTRNHPIRSLKPKQPISVQFTAVTANQNEERGIVSCLRDSAARHTYLLHVL